MFKGRCFSSNIQTFIHRQYQQCDIKQSFSVISSGQKRIYNLFPLHSIINININNFFLSVQEKTSTVHNIYYHLYEANCSYNSKSQVITQVIAFKVFFKLLPNEQGIQCVTFHLYHNITYFQQKKIMSNDTSFQ